MKDAQFVCPHCGEELKSRWIPVSERLPEDGVEVLFVDSGGDIYMGDHVSGVPQWEKDNGFWSGKFYNNITHWMPLPEPPTEE